MDIGLSPLASHDPSLTPERGVGWEPVGPKMGKR